MIGPLLLFGGYLLIYAATAKGGKFATEPWNGVFTDAYTDMPGGVLTKSQITAAEAHPLSPTAPNLKSPVRPRTPRGFTG